MQKNNPLHKKLCRNGMAGNYKLGQTCQNKVCMLICDLDFAVCYFSSDASNTGLLTEDVFPQLGPKLLPLNDAPAETAPPSGFEPLALGFIVGGVILFITLLLLLFLKVCFIFKL